MGYSRPRKIPLFSSFIRKKRWFFNCCFDLSNKNTFDGAIEWYTKTIQDVGQIPVCVICGNKSDLIDEVDTSKCESWAKANGCVFIKTSALDGTNVKEMFDILTKKLINLEIERLSQLDIKKGNNNEKNSQCNCWIVSFFF